MRVTPQRLTPDGPRWNGRTFTEGKVYEAHRVREDLDVYEVRDDTGHTRVILPDGSPCAHLVRRYMRGHSDYLTQDVVGCFVEVPE